jgi:hypothetical protein
MFASIVDGSVVGVTYQKTVATVENIVHDRMKVQQQGFLHNSSQRRSDPHIVLGIDTTNAPSRNVPEASVVKRSEQIRHTSSDNPRVASV